MERVPALDGLRAVAVLGVVGLHMHLPGFAGGGYGVDIFFALSGYLISTLLLNELERTKALDLRRFDLRRALRLLPALFICVLVTVPLDLTSGGGRGGGHLALAVPATLLYVSNIAVSLDYRAPGLLGQTWSLSVEEQFYMLWPLVLLSVRARRTLPTWLPFAVVFAVLSRTFWVLALHRDGLWTPIQLDGLMLCVLVAVRQRQGRLPGWLASAALPWLTASVLAPCLVFGDNGDVGLGQLLRALVVVLTAVLISHLVLRHDSVAAAALSLTPIRAVGRVSYGIYLFHYAPVLWLLGHERPIWQVLVIGGCVTAALTVASYLLVERPLLCLRDNKVRSFESVESARRVSP